MDAILDTEATTEKRMFDLADVLSVITAQQFSARLIAGVKDVMNFLPSTSLEKCGEYLLEQFPQFKSYEFLSSLFRMNRILRKTSDSKLRWYFKNCWLMEQKKKYGETLEVQSFPR